jgi:hypothetical protein
MDQQISRRPYKWPAFGEPRSTSRRAAQTAAEGRLLLPTAPCFMKDGPRLHGLLDHRPYPVGNRRWRGVTYSAVRAWGGFIGVAEGNPGFIEVSRVTAVPVVV